MEDPACAAGCFYPCMAVMAHRDLAELLERTINEGRCMTEKVCPFDKKPCIKELCAVFREDSGICSFRLIGTPRKVTPPSLAKQGDDRSSSKGYKAHLFD